MLDTIPWKHAGFLAGGTVMIFAPASLLERRMTVRCLVVAFAAMAFFYYVPFDKLQLSPNGDFSWARGITCSPELSKRSWPIGPLVMSWAVLMVISGFFAGVITGTLVGTLRGIRSTLAAALGYSAGRKMHKGDVPFGKGAAEGIAATEDANSAVSGSNLIPALSPGIPGACRTARRPTPHPIQRTGRHGRINRQTEHPFHRLGSAGRRLPWLSRTQGSDAASGYSGERGDQPRNRDHPLRGVPARPRAAPDRDFAAHPWGA